MKDTAAITGETPNQKKPQSASRALPPCFPLPLRLERTGPRLGVLRAPFVYLSTSLGRIEVEEGFDTDYASVPRIFWSIYPPDGSYTEAAIIHDALYFYQTAGIGRPAITRVEADDAFLDAMEALGVPWLRRHILHKSVKAGGWVAWNRNKKWKTAEGERRADEAAATDPVYL